MSATERVTRRVIPLVPLPTSTAISAAHAAFDFEPAVRIHARQVNGRHARWRWALLWLTQLVFCGVPWLNWQGRQAVLFDLEARRFYLFDAVLFPQDLIFLTGLLVFSALLLFAATAVAGRVWCGFACPQTVYTALFMWIEQRIEGDRLARQRLDAAPWTSSRKLLRRGARQLAWVAVSLVIGFSLVAWFTPARSLAQALPTLSLGPWEAFWLLFYAAATYVHAGLLREKVCQHACPYGRFQGSMLDAHSLVVGYDAARGEPRGARARGADAHHQAQARGQGDCVNCTLCVQVCPVGIDIRHGLQAACISCGLCIDACDQVMDKLGAPRGLVRFGAMQPAGLGAGGWRAALARPRVAVYASALALLAAAMAWGWAQRPTLRLNVLRDRGVLARQAEDGAVENIYRLQVMNASLQPRALRLQALADVADVADGPAATPLSVSHQGALQVDAAGATTLVVTVRMPADQLARQRPGAALPIRLIVDDGAGHAAQAPSTFLPG